MGASATTSPGPHGMQHSTGTQAPSLGCSLTPAEAPRLFPEGLVLLGQQVLLLPPGQLPLDGQQLQAVGDARQAALGLLLDLQLQSQCLQLMCTGQGPAEAWQPAT